MIDSLKAYMKDMGYSKINDFKGILHKNIAPADELTIHKGYAVVDLDRCNSCGVCWNIGHCPAISHPGNVTTIDANKCLGCSTCVDVCPRKAINMVAGGRI